MKNSRWRVAAAAFLIAVCLLSATLTAGLSEKQAGTNENAVSAQAAQWDGEASTHFEGTGWQGYPYFISTAGDLKLLADLVNSGDPTYNNSEIYYEITADIELNDTTYYNVWGDGLRAKNEWTPIGLGDEIFSANIDGKNHTVSGIYINDPQMQSGGLFGRYNGSIKNIRLEKGYILCGGYSGSIAGSYVPAEDSVSIPITGCYNSVSVKAYPYDYAGGIVGSGDADRCVNTGIVTARFCGGGISGSGSVYNSVNTGTVTAVGEPGSAGGIVGQVFRNETGSISGVWNCLNSGFVYGSYAGGIASVFDPENADEYTICASNINYGFVYNKNFLFYGLVTTNEIAVQYSYYAIERGVNLSSPVPESRENHGFYIGENPGTMIALLDTEMRSFYDGHTEQLEKLCGWEIKDGVLIPSVKGLDSPLLLDWAPQNPSAPTEMSFRSGDGSAANPYLIYTPEELERLSYIIQTVPGLSPLNNQNVHYKLMKDIVLNSVLNGGNYDSWMDYKLANRDGSGENNTLAGLKKWLPIGGIKPANDFSSAFNANFDGNGKKIIGLYTDGGGFFGCLSKSATVKNLGVIGYAEGAASGGIAAMNFGNILGCYFNGAAVHSYFDTILRSYSDAILYPIGGIAGENHGVINFCYNEGSVYADSIGSNGGIAGENKGVIYNCYNKGVVYISAQSGGIAGGNAGRIQNCYNSKSLRIWEAEVVAGSLFAGGIVGFLDGNDDATIVNCYYDGEIRDYLSEHPITFGPIVGLFQIQSADPLQVFNCYYTSDYDSSNSYYTYFLARMADSAAFDADYNIVSPGKNMPDTLAFTLSNNILSSPHFKRRDGFLCFTNSGSSVSFTFAETVWISRIDLVNYDNAGAVIFSVEFEDGAVIYDCRVSEDPGYNVILAERFSAPFVGSDRVTVINFGSFSDDLIAAIIEDKIDLHSSFTVETFLEYNNDFVMTGEIGIDNGSYEITGRLHAPDGYKLKVGPYTSVRFNGLTMTSDDSDSTIVENYGSLTICGDTNLGENSKISTVSVIIDDGYTGEEWIRVHYDGEIRVGVELVKKGSAAALSTKWLLCDDVPNRGFRLRLNAAGDVMEVSDLYTLTLLDYNGNDLGGSEEIAFNSSFKLAIPTRTGYTFEGWYDAPEEYSNAVTDETGDSVNVFSGSFDINVYARWTANTYIVSYFYDGASGDSNPTTANVTFDATYTLEAPAKTGYTFEYWYMLNNGVTEEMTDSEGSSGQRLWGLTSDTVLIAKWTPKSYTVIFDTRGGSEQENLEAIYGTAFTYPVNPEKDGNSFLGWYTAQDDNRTIVKDGEIWNIDLPSDSTVTLYAGWLPDAIVTTVYYYYDGADGSNDEKNKQIALGAADTEFPTPSKTGYNFEGWFTGIGGGGVRITDADGRSLDSWAIGMDVTLFVHWTPKQFVLTYNYDGASGGNTEDSKTVAYGESTTLALPEKTGYIFDGWYSSAGGTGVQLSDKSGVMPDVWTGLESITVYAKWTPAQYSLRLETGDGKQPESFSVTYDSTYGNLPVPSPQPGYKFDGWYTQPNGEGDKIASDTIVKITGDSIGLYAKWLKISYRITFEADGSELNSQTKNYGETITVPNTPVKDGYTFIGWYIGDKAVDFSKPFDYGDASSGSIAFVAKWEKNEPSGNLTWLWILLGIVGLAAVGLLAFIGIRFKKSESAVTASAGGGDGTVLPAGAGVVIGGYVDRSDRTVEDTVLRNADDINKDLLVAKLFLLSNQMHITLNQMILYAEGLQGKASVRVERGISGATVFYAGDYIMAIHTQKDSVHKLIVRMETGYADSVKKMHPSVSSSKIIAQKNWYDVVVDDTFIDKTEVCRLLENAYLFVVDKVYLTDGAGMLLRDESKAEAENKSVIALFEKNKNNPDKDLDAAVSIYESRRSFKFISKKQVVDYAQGLEGGGMITAINRKQTRPTTIKCDDKFFMFVAEKKGITRIIFPATEDFAREIALTHPTIKKVDYIETESWYSIILGYTFSDFEMVKEFINLIFVNMLKGG